MNFIVASSLHEASRPLCLSADRLVLRATKEAREREAAEELRHRKEEERRARRKKGGRKRGRSGDPYAEAAAAASRGSLRISGTLLRSLCLAEARESCTASVAAAWEADADRLGAVLVHAVPSLALQAGLRVVLPADMGEYLFDVQTELLAHGRLVVLTSWDSLPQVAVQPRLGPHPQRLFAKALFLQQQQHMQHMQMHPGSDGKALTATTGAPPLQQQQQRESASAATVGASPAAGPPPPSSSTPRSTASAGGKDGSVRNGGSAATPPIRPVGGGKASASGGGGGWATKHQRTEPVLDLVPAHTSGEDVRDLNELMEAGVLSVEGAGQDLAGFLCAHCARLPLVTLTMACCGALVCSRCLPPPPPQSQGCRICAEEPLDPPVGHPRRDTVLSALVRQLKVLYLPQLRALRRRQSQSEIRNSPDLSGLNSPYMMDPSPLGLL